MDELTFYDAESVDPVRLLLGDDLTDPERQVFNGAEIANLLALNGGNPRRAAAQGLLLIAQSEVRLSKRITTQDLSTDGVAVAAELRAQAAELRRQADEADAAHHVSVFEIVEYPYGRTLRPELTERSWL